MLQVTSSEIEKKKRKKAEDKLAAKAKKKNEEAAKKAEAENKQKKRADETQEAIMVIYKVDDTHPLYNLNGKQGRTTLERLFELNKENTREDVRFKKKFLKDSLFLIFLNS